MERMTKKHAAKRRKSLFARTLAQYFKEEIKMEVTQDDLEEHKLKHVDRKEERIVVLFSFHFVCLVTLPLTYIPFAIARHTFTEHARLAH